MHIFAKHPDEPMFLNVDKAVGKRGANKRLDTLLVQFLIQQSAASVPGKIAAKRLARMKKSPTNGNCDDLTIDAIKATQEQMRAKKPGTVVDGRVSPARGYSYGGGVWTIVTLNDVVSKHCRPDVYPRLDLLANCPRDLRDKVRSLFIQF